VETHRFRARSSSESGAPWAAGYWKPLAVLARDYPIRAIGIGLVGAAGAAGHTAAFQFSAYFVQVEHGWSPGQYTLMAIIAGVVGIAGHPFAGRLADRRGRKSVGCTLFAVYPLLVYGFYHAPGWLLPFLWIPLIFALTGGGTIQRALAAELFPTESRGTASGWALMCEAAGRSAGLFLVAWGTPAGESNTAMICFVALFCLMAAIVILWLPETGGRELEAISPVDEQATA
jgi:predicted MFS family arabinose efflux permease